MGFRSEHWTGRMMRAGAPATFRRPGSPETAFSLHGSSFSKLRHVLFHSYPILRPFQVVSVLILRTEPRSTRDTGRINSCLVNSGSLILRINSSTAFSPFAEICCFTVVSPGGHVLRNLQIVKPHKGDLVRYLDTALIESFCRSDCQNICRSYHRCGRGVPRP